MPIVRLVMLLLVFGGLTLFTLQNQLPRLSLIFLGLRSPELPLALWILLAITAGVVTTLVITGLTSLSGYPQRRRRKAKPFRQATASRFYQPPPSREPEPSPAETTWQREPVSEPSYTAPVNDASDWDDTDDDDWFEDEPIDRPRSQDDWESDDRRNAQAPARRTDYEVKQEPKSSSQSGSVYSYSYRDPPGSSGVGKTESVVDADYRVIVPPYESIEEEEEEDFGEDDEFEDDLDRRPRPRS